MPFILTLYFGFIAGYNVLETSYSSDSAFSISQKFENSHQPLIDGTVDTFSVDNSTISGKKELKKKSSFDFVDDFRFEFEAIQQPVGIGPNTRRFQLKFAKTDIAQPFSSFT